MTAQIDKAVALAEKITSKAEGALEGIEREMIIMKWPPEFRAILWGTVAAIAAQRRDDAEARS